MQYDLLIVKYGFSQSPRTAQLMNAFFCFSISRCARRLANARISTAVSSFPFS